MKHLFVLRHAKSSWSEPSLSDHDRPLKKRGRKAAPRMGRFAAEQGALPECVLSSTAVRARATADAFVSAAGLKLEVQLEPRIYEASVEDIFEILSSQSSESIMVVGHNPTMESLVWTLTGQEVTMVTAALACIELPIDAWSELGRDTQGQLKSFWKPRALPESFV